MPARLAGLELEFHSRSNTLRRFDDAMEWPAHRVSLRLVWKDVMKVSWNWIADYVDLSGVSALDAAERLALAGLNRESVDNTGWDTQLDVEVTSNRPDCLGHIGIARELSVLLSCDTRFPQGSVAELEGNAPVESATRVDLECPDLCPAYIARVIRGVEIKESPDWLQRRLQTIGISPVNNIVDATNYVMMECGQPLHAFDYAKLSEGRIIVRRARPGETIQAIDHREYPLDSEMCVIADAVRPVAIGGVMGGAATEISSDTTDVLIEAALFAPMSIRSTARKLKLHSDSSYRFERGTDDQQLDWASRRCCEIILHIARGELFRGHVLAGDIPAWEPPSITLRLSRLQNLLGIDIAEEEVLRILGALGLSLVSREEARSTTWRPPSWRRDLMREVDLIEEIARIHGLGQIPADRPISVVPSTPSLHERVLEKARGVLLAAGMSEAITYSFVPDQVAELLQPVADAIPLRISPAAGEYGQTLRSSLIPSLLRCRRENERRGTLNVELFELSRVYLGTDPNDARQQPIRLSWVCGRSFREARGLIEAVAGVVCPEGVLTFRPFELPQLVEGRGAEVLLQGKPWGWLGELDREAPGVRDWKLREEATAVELDWQTLLAEARLGRTVRPIPRYPAIDRDLNFVLDDEVTWDHLERVIREAAGEYLVRVSFVEQYRGQHIPAGKKSYVVSLSFQAEERTLTADEIDQSRLQVVAACERQLQAVLR